MERVEQRVGALLQLGDPLALLGELFESGLDRGSVDARERRLACRLRRLPVLQPGENRLASLAGLVLQVGLQTLVGVDREVASSPAVKSPSPVTKLTPTSESPQRR